MMYWNGHMTTAGWIIAILWTAIIFALLAGAIYWLVTAPGARGQDGGKAAEASAREILDRRLAKGEVTIEQHKQLREAIDEGSAPAGERQATAQPASAPG